jgi:ferric-dicitrate binding protein FerR (iron transport regulator)
MHPFETDILPLILRKLDGSATAEELVRLQVWVDEKEENARLFSEISKTWKESGKAQSNWNPDTEAAWKKVRTRTLDKEVPVRALHFNWFRMAAGFLLLLGAFGLWYRNSIQESTFTWIQSGDELKEIWLPDSSRVMLDRNSCLAYASFKGDFREVKLKGRAFFQVQKNPDQPFRIEARQSLIQVLGTSFEVISDSLGEDEIHVTTGKVRFRSRVKEDTGLILVAGEHARMQRNAKPVRILQQDLNAQSWHTRKLHFEDAQLEEVRQALARYFNKEIEIGQASLENCRFTGHFDQPDLEQIEQVLKVSLNLQIEKRGNTIRWLGPGCP